MPKFLDRKRVHLRTYPATDKDHAVNARETERFAHRVIADFTPYTPVWTTTGDPTDIDDGSLIGKYRDLGPMVWVVIELLFGAGTDPGTGFWSFSLPFASHPDHNQSIPGRVIEGTVGNRTPLAGEITPGSASIARVDYAGGSATASLPFTWANTHGFVLQGFYVPHPQG